MSKNEADGIPHESGVRDSLVRGVLDQVRADLARQSEVHHRAEMAALQRSSVAASAIAHRELSEPESVPLAPVGEVLRVLVLRGYRAELVALLREGFSEESAGSLAAELRAALAGELLRRLASEVWSGGLAAYVPEPSTVSAAGLARRVRSAEPGVGIQRGFAASGVSAHGIEWRFIPDDGLAPRYRRVEPSVDEQAFAWLTACRLGNAWTVRDLLEGSRSSEVIATDPPTVKGPKAAVRVSGSAPLARRRPVDWFAELFIRADWPGEEPAQRPAWPWGEYSTPDLELVAEAVRAFWIEWDGEAASAPKNDTVIAWLEARGMSNNLAKVVATLIRSPKVPAGARPRRDE